MHQTLSGGTDYCVLLLLTDIYEVLLSADVLVPKRNTHISIAIDFRES